ETAINHRTFFEASSHGAIGDRHHLCRASITETKRTLQANAVVPRRVHGAVRDVNVAAAIDIHAVPIRVNREIVDCEVIEARGQNSKMTAVQNGEITQQYVAAIL